MRISLLLLLITGLTLTGCDRPRSGAEGGTSDATDPGSSEAAQAVDALRSLGLDIHAREQASPFMALVRTSGAEDSAWIGAGVFIEPTTLVVPYQLIDEAASIELDLGNCDSLGVRGVIGVDPSCRVALLATDAAPPGVAPITLGEIPAQDEPLGLDGIVTALTLECGFMAVHEAEGLYCVDVRHLAGLGPTIVINQKTGILGYGSLVRSVSGDGVGILLGPAGGGASHAFPTAAIVNIERHEPVPLEVFAARERTPAENAVLFRHRAERARIDGRLADAMEHARLALGYNAGDWNAMYELGVCEDLAGEPEASLEWLARSIELEPGFSESQYSRGLVLLKAGRAEAAIDPLREAARLDPEYAAAHGMLAVAFHELGRMDDAIDAGERSIAVRSADGSHFSNLCLFYGQLDRLPDVERVARLWTQSHERDPDAWRSLGEALFEQERYEDATVALDTALAAGADDVGTYRRLIVSLAQAGHLDRAEELVHKAIGLFPGDEILPKLRSLIEQERRDGG